MRRKVISVWLVCSNGKMLEGYLPRRLVVLSMRDNRILDQSFKLILAEGIEAGTQELFLTDIWADFQKNIRVWLS